MTPEQLRHLDEVFRRAKGLAPNERRALLDAEYADDPEVRAQIEILLAQGAPDATVQDPERNKVQAMDPGSQGENASESGPDIEGYEITREIHRGGQGIVYQAVQKSTKRKVAIKVLLEGPYASKSAKRRFDREIELVAQLKHPNIIAIFHSGQTKDGHQYCVMDYVRGFPLDQYARNEKLALEDALKLFSTVCGAVNYAHQKGVIHRDLKPSNILVDGNGVPKVLDFGLAKQMVSREKTQLSLTGQVVGTLPYMSPEQAGGNPDQIDIRTDVYALGVILYQMLTGHFPYPVAGQMAEVLKHIAETEPTPPSRSWKSDSGITKRTTRRLRAGECPIDDEVQTIVLRTLAKDRERRYQSAGELAQDVAHYLADEPIEAKRDSGWYVLKKQLRRYKLPVAVAAAFVVVVTVALVVSLSLWRQAERDRAAAVEERDKAETINAFVTKALVSSDPRQRGGQTFLVTDAMDQAVKLLDAGELNHLPKTEAALRLTISQILNGNARSQEALRLAQMALEIGEGLHRGDHPDVAISLNIVASCLVSLGRCAEALPKHEAALGMQQRLFEGDHPNVATGLNNVALCLGSLGRWAEALPKLEAALEMQQRLFEGDHPDVAMGLNNVASCLNSLGRSAEALPKYEASLAMYQRLFEGDHPEVARGLSNVAFCLGSLGRWAEALPKLEVSLAMYQRLFEGDHPEVARGLNNVASCLDSMGRPAEALPKNEAALAMYQRLFRSDHPEVATSMSNVASCLKSLGRSAEALPRYEAALTMDQRLFEGDHPDVALGLTSVASCLESLGRSAEALPKYEAALEMSRRVLPLGHPHTLLPQIGLAESLMSLGRHAEAEPLLLDAAEQCERCEASRRMYWRDVVKALVELHDAWHAVEPDQGHDAKAAAWRKKIQAATRRPTTQPTITSKSEANPA